MGDVVPWGMIEDPAPGPVESAIISEEYLMNPRHTKSGQLDVDTVTGKVRLEPLTLFGVPRLVDRKIGESCRHPSPSGPSTFD
jgi:hypothetical protein